jgi:EAL domain-containing protein (putative c-di-GMP-specific phosphodiesterase class I)
MVAHRVIEALRAPFAVGGRAVHIGASVGIACVGSRSVDADEMLADADLAMYAAKAAGKGKAVTFTPNLRKAAVGQLALEEDLRYAATRGLFRLDYQPVVELSTGAFIGGEALIRWPHPTRGMVPPLDFIPLAEDTGLVVPLGSWVLEQACAQGAAWRRTLGSGDQAAAGTFTMNVNVSSRQVVEADFVHHVAGVLERTEIDPRSVVLEMTESVFMADDAHSRRVMSGLRDLGVRIAIDDFGTGYSSLAYLRRLPIDILKLDRSFVTDLADGTSERVITSAVVEIAHQLDLMVIAEGIETMEQLELLVELGCTAGQGYLLHRPMPADAFTERLVSR